MNTPEVRQKGHVKFFNSLKGYGFILPQNQEEGEVFVHHTAIHNDGGFKSLAEGEEVTREQERELQFLQCHYQVEYSLLKGPKGMQASNVTGPDGTSVQGDPRNQQRNQSNRISLNNGGYLVDPYSAPVGYPPMPMYPMYGAYIYPPYFSPNESPMYNNLEQNK